MKTKVEAIRVMCIIFIFILATSPLVLSEETELIWKIGKKDGKWSEFSENLRGPVNYSVGTNLSNFSRELNDWNMNLTKIYIRYNLNDTQAKKDMKLSLCVAYLHEDKSFGFRVSVNNIKIDEDSFTPENIRDSCYNIVINKTCKPGENVMLIENTNPNQTNHWLYWDSLNLTGKEEHCEGDLDCCSDQYCGNNKCENQKEDSFPCLRQSECKSNHCVHDVCRPTDPYCGDDYCDVEENCEQDSCCNGINVSLETDKNNCGKCNNMCYASCCNSKCANPKGERSCHNGDVYYIDSCGNWGELFGDCEDSEECSDGECKKKPEESRIDIIYKIVLILVGIVTILGWVFKEKLRIIFFSSKENNQENKTKNEVKDDKEIYDKKISMSEGDVYMKIEQNANQKVEQVQNAKQEVKAQKVAEIGSISGHEVIQNGRARIKLTTGSKELDDLLGGGVETQAITQVYGNLGSGKTQLAHQLAVTVQLPEEKGGLNGSAIYIDTENTFRPDRIKSMAKALNLDPEEVLKNIHVLRADNSDQQLLLAEKASEMAKEKNVRFVAVDSLISHFRTEYIGKEKIATRQQKLNRHMHTLKKKLADTHNIAVLVTNQVRVDQNIMFGDNTVPLGGQDVKHLSTFIIKLRKSKGNKVIARLINSPNLPIGNECVFEITDEGIRD